MLWTKKFIEDTDYAINVVASLRNNNPDWQDISCRLVMRNDKIAPNHKEHICKAIMMDRLV